MLVEYDHIDPLEEGRQALIGGDVVRACDILTAMLPRHTHNAAMRHLLGMAQAANGRYAEAIESIQQALQMDETEWRWRVDLGTVHSAAQEWGSAAEQFDLVLKQVPEERRALLGCGKAALEMRCFDWAASCYEKILLIDPPNVPARSGLARAYMGQERFDEAEQLLKESLAVDHEQIDDLRILATIYSICGENELAREYWERTAALAPYDLSSIGALVYQCWQLGDLDSTLAYARRIIDTGRASVDLHSFYLYLLLYSDKETASSIKAACEAFGREIAPKGPIECPPRGSNGARRLRIGYLTGEFMTGPAFYFLSSLLGNHDPDVVDVFCYHTRHVHDDRTSWFQQLGRWRDCRDVGDELVRRQIREDGIDILVDLSGFFPDNKLTIFAGRAAPVQATYPNCPITTGVSQMDYIFTDRFTCPPGAESQYTEEAVYLPSGYLVYSPPADYPPITPLPANSTGGITFGLFQRRAKMNAGVWDAAAEVLRRCRDARLLIQSGDPNLDDSCSRASRELIGEFSARGVGRERLCLVGTRPHLETMSLMGQVDIALDTFPYQGQTTTCECLWMGVPVVALSSRAHVGRVGTAILQRAGFPDWAAETPQDYMEIAVALASDRSQLARWRAGMRERLRQSSVCNGTRLAREVEAAYQWMWKQGR